jgi:hypothetical protein
MRSRGCQILAWHCREQAERARWLASLTGDADVAEQLRRYAVRPDKEADRLEEKARVAFTW